MVLDFSLYHGFNRGACTYKRWYMWDRIWTPFCIRKSKRKQLYNWRPNR